MPVTGGKNTASVRWKFGKVAGEGLLEEAALR